jgi:hypothetical protein
VLGEKLKQLEGPCYHGEIRFLLLYRAKKHYVVPVFDICLFLLQYGVIDWNRIFIHLPALDG